MIRVYPFDVQTALVHCIDNAHHIFSEPNRKHTIGSHETTIRFQNNRLKIMIETVKGSNKTERAQIRSDKKKEFVRQYLKANDQEWHNTKNAHNVCDFVFLLSIMSAGKCHA